MADLVDLTDALDGRSPIWRGARFDWHALAEMWDGNRMREAHDWLNERWTYIVRHRPGGHGDPDARFLQGLAFAVNALYFTQNANQDGALLMLDDALVQLGGFRPAFLGVSVEPILDTLHALRPTIVALGPSDEFPIQPFVYRKFELLESAPCLLN